MANETLLQMAAFNFNEPIQVTISFDDSDNDDIMEHTVPTDTTLTNKTFVTSNNTKQSEVLKIKDLKTKRSEYIQKNRDQKRKYFRRESIQNTVNYDNSTRNRRHSIPNETSYLLTTERNASSNISSTPTDENGQVFNNNYPYDFYTVTKIVADYIIYFIKTHQRIYKMSNATTNITKEEQMFIKTKYRLYKELHTELQKIITYELEDTRFVETFLKYTFDRAVHQRVFCYYSDVEKVYSEMKFFTTTRNNTQFTSENLNSISLNDVLNKRIEDLLSNNPPEIQMENNNSEKTCIFTSGMPGEEININVDTMILNNITQNNYSNNKIIPNNSVQALDNYVTTYESYGRHIQKARTGPTHYQIEQSCHRKVQEPEVSQLQLYLQNTAPPAYYEQVRNPPRETIMDQGHLQTQNNTYRPNFNNYLPDTPNHTPVINPEFVNFRPISRDSGIISPNSYSESELSPLFESEEQVLPSPYITHVTSLHPNVTPIILGPCYVCGIQTRRKCRGCVQYYYCSYECHLKDWPTHRRLCYKSDNNPQTIPNM